jgi:hypothetical protein
MPTCTTTIRLCKQLPAALVVNRPRNGGQALVVANPTIGDDLLQHLARVLLTRVERDQLQQVLSRR